MEGEFARRWIWDCKEIRKMYGTGVCIYMGDKTNSKGEGGTNKQEEEGERESSRAEDKEETQMRSTAEAREKVKQKPSKVAWGTDQGMRR